MHGFYDSSPAVADGNEYEVVLRFRATITDAVGLQSSQMGGLHFRDPWELASTISTIALPLYVGDHVEPITRMLDSEHVRFVPTGAVLEVTAVEQGEGAEPHDPLSAEPH
jgi:hypothetical protein